MKKTTVFFGALALGVTAWAGVASTPDDEIIALSTPGPDTYADGTLVENGEVYALVWQIGDEFDGFTATGEAAGAAEGEKVLIKAPCAKGGRLRRTFFIVDPETKATCASGGKYAVYLLDTRIVATEADGDEYVSKVTGVGLGTGVVNAFSKVDATIYENGAINPVAAATGATSTDTASLASATAKQPTIKNFEVSGGYAYITISNLPDLVRVSEGDDISALAPGAGEAPTSIGDDTAVIIRKAEGETGFFSIQGIK